MWFGELQYLIDNEEQEMYDLNLFLKNVRKYTNPEELTAEMLNDLIDKILVHAPDRSSGQRTQKIEIYYKAVGIIEIPDLDECFTAKMKQKDSKMTAYLTLHRHYITYFFMTTLHTKGAPKPGIFQK